MAWLEQKQSGTYHIAFRFQHRRFKRSLKTKNEKQANAQLARLEETIELVERGRILIPDDAEIVTFLLSDGKLDRSTKTSVAICTMRQLFDAFVDSIPHGSLEQSTLIGMRVHTRHLTRILGGATPIRGLQMTDLQKYVDQRSLEDGRRGRNVSPATIKKELTTLRLIWNWARHAGHIQQELPQKGLRFPKTVEKPPFQTWREIEHKIERGGLVEAEAADLWDCLFLTLPEVSEVLAFVQAAAQHSFIFPMFVFAAHTGARRSEMLRSRLEDVDLKGRTVTIREKKRVRGRLTTRSVSLSPELHRVLGNWLTEHPGGKFTFCMSGLVQRSKKSRHETTPITPDEAHHHFKHTLRDSKWSRLRGWHVFRHSFCSNCAAGGIDQRIIDAWVGHQTEEMVRRYRHLFPNQQQEAISTVFCES